MRTRVVQFTCKLVFVGAILFSVGTFLFTQHTEIIAAPKSAYAAMPDLLILPQQQHGYQANICLKQPYENVSNSNVPGTPTSPTTPLEKPESNVNDCDTPDTIMADSIEDGQASYLQQEQETVMTLSAGQSFNGMDTAKTARDQSIEKTDDTNITDTPAEQVLTRIRTKMKYVEAILKKAVIKPYQINGQIEGLQITGLEKILAARDLLLKSGDIIRTVNGHSLSSKKRAYEVFKRARKLPMIEIELLRDGKSRTLLYCLK